MDVNTAEDFDQYELNLDILRGIYTFNYDKPTLIQHKALTELLSSKDIKVLSPFQTGKTGSYIIYSLQKINNTINDIQVLVLSSTRDHAVAIGNTYKYIGKYTKAKFHSFVGGTSIKDDIKKLSEGVHIVVGTPGRVLDMINKKILSLNELKLFIIDEVDEVFKRGFTESIKHITEAINSLPTANKIQKAVFSSSGHLPEDIDAIIKMKDPVLISYNIENQSMLLKNLRQFRISLKEEWKFEILLNIFKMMELSQAVIYCSTRERCETLNYDISKQGFTSSFLTDDKEKIISNFGSGYLRVVILTSEISTKEIDLYQEAIVINYDFPKDVNEYCTRNGRIEAFSNRGIVINFITEDDKEVFENVQKISPNGSIEELPTELSSIDK